MLKSHQQADAPSSQTAIRVQDLRKAFKSRGGKVQALNGVSFRLRTLHDATSKGTRLVIASFCGAAFSTGLSSVFEAVCVVAQPVSTARGSTAARSIFMGPLLTPFVQRALLKRVALTLPLHEQRPDVTRW